MCIRDRPIGTITIQETKAPEGYLLNPEVFVRQITSTGTSESVNTYNNPIVPENVMKLDLKKVQEGTETVSYTHLDVYKRQLFGIFILLYESFLLWNEDK